jgi:hypothetical protein
MAVPNVNDELVARAVRALRRLAEATPVAAATEAAAEDLAAAWHDTPFTIGLTGDSIAARTQLLDQLCGGGMLEFEGRVPGCAPIRVRRGPVTRFRATRRDGTCEEMELPRLVPAGPVPGKISHAETMRTVVAERQAVVDRAEAAVPKLVRVSPPAWAFWLWIARWLMLLTSKRARATWHRAQAQLARAQLALAAAEDEVPTVVGTLPAETGEQFFKRLYVLCSGMIAGRDVRAIEIEVAGGPLPEGVEVIEGARAGEVDELVTIAAGTVHIPRTDRSLGPLAEAALVIGGLPGEARALRLAQRARDMMVAHAAALDDAIAQAEVELRNRIARLENLVMSDPDGFVRTQLKRMPPQLGSSINAVLEHAGVHLSSELAACSTSWIALVDAAPSPDELKAAAAKIDQELPQAARRIADETRMLVMGGVGGCAHDLLPPLLEPLRQPGLPDEHAQAPRAVPALPAVEMLPSLTHPSGTNFAGDLSGAGQWLTGLFRSIDARRAELRAKVEQRTGHIREVAEAELRDAEPRLSAVLREVVARELSAAVERRVSWLARELAIEQLAVDSDRAALRPLADILDDARREARQLYDLIAERQAPAAPAPVASST